MRGSFRPGLLARHAFAAATMACAASAYAATATEACKDMTNKLAVVYSVYGYPEAFYADQKRLASPVETAERVVSAAYGTSKGALDKQWPGFFDWSTLTVLTALKESQSRDTFRKSSLLQCLVRYG